VLSGLHPVNYMKQSGSNVCIKLPRKRVQSALQINTQLPVGFIITNHGTLTRKYMVQSLIKTAEVLIAIRYDITGGHL
jgi:hypothetical protein